MITRLDINGKRAINLPGSDLWINEDGDLVTAYSRRIPKGKQGYYVLRGNTKRYYSREKLKELYAKFAK